MEPFAEKVECSENGISSSRYRLGYRCSTTDVLLAQLEIPANVVELAVLSKLSIALRITPGGSVTADIPAQDDLDINGPLKIDVTPVSELISRSLMLENLRLEEADISNLEVLRDQLEQSLSKVLTTLALIKYEHCFQSGPAIADW